MSDNEMEADVSFLPGPGHGGTGKRNVYEPDPSQRCKQLVCSKRTAVIIVTLLCIIIIGIALIAAFARPSESICITGTAPTHSPQVEASTPATATNGERFPWTDIRLPPSIIPSDYDISLHPNLTTFHFTGNVTIQIKALRSTDFIVFHARDLNFSRYELSHIESDKKINIVRTLHYPRHQQVYLELEHDLTEGKTYKLMLSFNGILSNNMAGFYRSSYTTSQGEKRWLATTQFEPVDARAAFPCFDEPSMKAYFALSMIRDKNNIALFNMPKLRSTTLDNGLVMDRFEKSVRMSTYLVAFVVCDFESINSTTADNVKVTVYTPPEQIEQAQFALESAKNILEHYEEFFGIKYPLPKQDLIAIPDFSLGAMENWGLITYRTQYLLFDELLSTEHDKMEVAIVIAHELAHQWFGNLVTMKWWNDLWLNEGFASFVEYIGADHVDPTWKMMDQFITIALIPALQLDSLSNSHPVSVTVQDPGEIGELFDTISYNKGASIIRMLEGFIGRDNLQKGLQRYLGTYKYSNAQTDDLWNSLTDVAQDVDVKRVMDTWTLQMGYPVITIKRNKERYTAEQSPFLLNPNTEHSKEYNSPFGYKWEVPLTYVTNQNPKQMEKIVWMHKGSAVIDVNEETRWIKANVNMTGFYRVHYDNNNWEQLSQQLMRDHTVLTSADRAGLIDDAFSLAAAGHMQVSQALDLIRYLVKEEDFLPWKVALAQLQFVMIHIQDLPVYEDFKVFFNTLLQSILDRLGWEDKGSYLDRQLRVDVLTKAVIYNHPETVRRAKAKFDDWMVNNTQVDPKIKQAIYRAGIQYGGQKEWNFCWDQYKKTNVPSEKHHLLYALAMTTDATQLNRFLYMSLEEDKIRSQDAISVIGAVSLSSSAGKTLAWSFVKRQWDTIMERFAGSAFKIPNLINKVPAGLTTPYDLKEVSDFFEAHPVPSATRAIAQALEKIQMRIDWIARNEADITEWTTNWMKEHKIKVNDKKIKKKR